MPIPYLSSDLTTQATAPDLLVFGAGLAILCGLFYSLGKMHRKPVPSDDHMTIDGQLAKDHADTLAAQLQAAEASNRDLRARMEAYRRETLKAEAQRDRHADTLVEIAEMCSTEEGLTIADFPERVAKSLVMAALHNAKLRDTHHREHLNAILSAAEAHNLSEVKDLVRRSWP